MVHRTLDRIVLTGWVSWVVCVDTVFPWWWSVGSWFQYRRKLHKNQVVMGCGQALLLRQSLPVLRLADELLQGHISVEIVTFPL